MDGSFSAIVSSEGWYFTSVAYESAPLQNILCTRVPPISAGMSAGTMFFALASLLSIMSHSYTAAY